MLSHTYAYTKDTHVGHKAPASCNLSRPVGFSASCRQGKWYRGLSVISSAWGEFWAVNKLLFQSFAVNISYSTRGDWRMKNSKCGSHHPYQPTQSAPHVTGSLGIGSPQGACNKHSEHVLSCWWGRRSHTNTLLYAHTQSHHLRARLGQPRAVNTPHSQIESIGKIGRSKYICP